MSRVSDSLAAPVRTEGICQKDLVTGAGPPIVFAMPKFSPKPTGGLPTSQQILDFIASAETSVGKREIAKAFGLHGAEKIALKALLKDMADEGLIDSAPGRAFHQMGGVRCIRELRIPVSLQMLAGGMTEPEILAAPTRAWPRRSECLRPSLRRFVADRPGSPPAVPRLHWTRTATRRARPDT